MSGSPGSRDEPVFDPPDAALRERVVRGTAITFAAQAIRLPVQMILVVVMSRLLLPSDFGLLAMVTPFYGIVLLFQDFGLTQTTIQRPRITHAQITVLFWLNVAVSLALALLLALLSPVVAWFYADERAAGLTQGFAAIAFLNGIAAQHLALINRSMRFRYLAALDTFAYVLGFLGAVLWAAALQSYWALFALPAITAVVTVIGAWIGIGFVPGWPRRERDIAEMLHLGGGITGFNVFNFIARNLDNVLIGHVWGNAALGLYDRAYKLLLFPLQQINAPLARVMMPTLARLQNDAQRYRTVYLSAVGQLLLVTQPGIVFTIATADTLIPTLLGKPWSGAAPIFLWLGLAALQQPISATTTWLFISQGRSKAYLYWGAFNAVTSTAAFAAGLPWGPVGVAAAYSITQIFPRMPVMWWMATRRGPVKLRDLYEVAIPHAAASAASFTAIIALRHATTFQDSVPGLLACLCTSYASALLMMALIPSGRATLRKTLSLIFGIMKRS